MPFAIKWALCNAVADLEGGSSVHMTDRINHMIGVCGMWGTCPPRKIFDFRPSEIAFGAVLG